MPPTTCGASPMVLIFSVAFAAASLPALSWSSVPVVPRYAVRTVRWERVLCLALREQAALCLCYAGGWYVQYGGSWAYMSAQLGTRHGLREPQVLLDEPPHLRLQSTRRLLGRAVRREEHLLQVLDDAQAWMVKG